MSLELTPQLFVLFAALVEEEAGLHYGTRDRAVLESKLASHASELGFDSLLDYYYRLRYDDPTGAQRRELVQALVVHETYFFRETFALEQVIEHYLAPKVRSHGHARVWSAACSTGEEPLTLAMLLDRRGLLDNVELVATDVSEAAIAKARTGIHARRSLRDGYPADLALAYLEMDARGVIVAPRIRDAVRFDVVNLLEGKRLHRLGTFDVILCRNVLIYFRDTQILQVIDTLREMLTPGGAIAVGVSESLMRFGTGVVCEERGGAFFYRSAG